MIASAFVNSLLTGLKISEKLKPLDQVVMMHLKSIAKNEDSFETKCAEKTIELWVKHNWQNPFEPCESKVISNFIMKPITEDISDSVGFVIIASKFIKKMLYFLVD